MDRIYEKVVIICRITITRIRVKVEATVVRTFGVVLDRPVSDISRIKGVGSVVRTGKRRTPTPIIKVDLIIFVFRIGDI